MVTQRDYSAELVKAAHSVLLEEREIKERDAYERVNRLLEELGIR